MCKEYDFFRDRLKHVFGNTTSVFVLLSGGLDSCLLLQEAHSILGDNVQAITFTSPLQNQGGVDYAISFAKRYFVKHRLIDYKPLADENISTNSMQRCYFCKRKMFSFTKKIANEEKKCPLFLDGSHIDDDPSLRPGMKASKEFGIISPWRELGIDKANIRDMAKKTGLDIWDKPSDSCLATRFPFGYKLTIDELKRLQVAEDALRELGITDFRLKPADSPPKLFCSHRDHMKIMNIGIDRVWNILRDKTGWQIKDGIIDTLESKSRIGQS